MSIEAMKQALEALDSKHDMTKAEWRVLQYRAFNALRAAIAEAEKQEPFAWMILNSLGDDEGITYYQPSGDLLPGWAYKPIYTHPPRREWVGLTDEDMALCESEEDVQFVRAIAAKLKEKNS